jgi:hypothetical protein
MIPRLCIIIAEDTTAAIPAIPAIHLILAIVATATIARHPALAGYAAGVFYSL